MRLWDYGIGSRRFQFQNSIMVHFHNFTISQFISEVSVIAGLPFRLTRGVRIGTGNYAIIRNTNKVKGRDYASKFLREIRLRTGGQNHEVVVHWREGSAI